MTQFKNFIGIDISKNTLDISLITEHGEFIELKWENDNKEIEKSLKTLYFDYKLEKDNTLICAEHTGHFGNKLIEVTILLEFKLWIESAYNILHSQGLTRGKSDKVDARRIMEYAKRFLDKAILWKPLEKSIKVLQRLNSERGLIVKDIAKYRGQLTQEEGFFDKEYFKEKKKRHNRLIKYNKKILSEIENKIDEIIEQSPEIKNNMENITSIVGVGKVTAIATIIATENFTKFINPRKFACHIGCAPFRYESGTSISSGHRVSHRANKNLKKIFHMAALSTLRTKGELRNYFDRKVEEGKNKMTVINAIRSKLVHRIFAVVKENRKYDKTYIHSLV